MLDMLTNMEILNQFCEMALNSKKNILETNRQKDNKLVDSQFIRI